MQIFFCLYIITLHSINENRIKHGEKNDVAKVWESVSLFIYIDTYLNNMLQIFFTLQKRSANLYCPFFLYLISLKYYFSFQQKKISDDFFHFDVDYSGEKMNLKTIQPFFLPMLHKISFLTKQQEIMKQRLKNFMPSPIEWGFSFTYVLLFANRTLLYTRQLSPPQLMGAASLLSSLCLTHT